MKVYVAMSGGVDSSVAAVLLKKQGFDVTGVFFKPWSSFAPPSAKPSDGHNKASEGQESPYCNWQNDRQDALRVASVLGIKFKTWDFSREYGAKVTRYMIDGYRRGLTPNPDVMCNKEIKFGLFLKKALAEGADYIATGHYVRSVKRRAKSIKPEYKLLKAKDLNKDQSYFLWTLTQKQLQHCLFPIGDYIKPEVRKLAKKFKLPTHNKKDSQGVCFVGELNMKDFLKEYIKPKPGKIKLLLSRFNLEKAKDIGSHDGAAYYTIGQRHGLNIGNGGGPYFVVSKDIRKNIIYVAREPKQLDGKVMQVAELNWITPSKLPLTAAIKIRYRNLSTPAKIRINGNAKSVVVKFAKPVRAITIGQSAVFYRGQEMLGGGIIK